MTTAHRVPTEAVSRAGGAALRIWRSRLGLGRAGSLGLAVVLLIVVLAVLAPWIAPQGPNMGDLLLRNRPPFSMSEHPLGTDPVGRDILSRLLYGAQVSLIVGVSAVALPGLVGLALGLTAGYVGGWVDNLIMRLVDGVLSLPSFTLAIFAVAVLGASIVNVILILTLTGWCNYARVIRGRVLSVREEDFIAAARVTGATTARILVRHVIPNVLAPLLVLATLQIAKMIIAESSLSFLGLGVGPQTPSWGGMAAEGRDHLATSWWVSTMPGMAIAVFTLAVNMFGEALRDKLELTAR